MIVNPRQWPTLELGEVLSDVQPGFASGKHSSDGAGVPHLRPMNVSTKGTISRLVLKFVDPTLADRPTRRLQRGDILFNNTNSPELVGKTALFDEDDQPAFSNHMTRLRVDQSRIDPGFLALRLHHAWREGWFARHCNNHVSQASVGRDVLLSFPIELPPLDVQRELAAIGAEVNRKRDSCADHLASVTPIVERLRRAILAVACSGRLTAEWRLRYPHEQSARVADDREGVSRKRTKHDSSLDIGGLPEIPPSWTYARADKVVAPGTAISYGIVVPGPEVGNGVPYVRQQDVSDGTVRVEQLKRTSRDIAEKHSRSALVEGDVLLCIIRNLRVAMVPPGIDGANITQGMVRLRPSDTVLGPYLAAYLENPYVQRWMKQRYIGLAMPRINVADARAIPIAVPPVQEQQEIVRRIEGLLTIAQRTSDRVDQVAELVAESSHAILAKAFRGELAVPSKHALELTLRL